MGAFALVFSVVAYVAFLLSFVYFIAFVGVDNFPVVRAAKTLDWGSSFIGAGPPVLINIGLLLLFTIQHSVMARPGFKRAITRVVPEAIERSVYVLASVAVLVILMAGWTPMPSVVWSIEAGFWKIALTALFWLGFGLVLVSTYQISHYELFGLAQGWRRATGKPTPTSEFRTPALYRVVRHPLYLGFLIAFWATPVMTAGHLLFASVWTAYILIAIGYEERDLLSVFGEKYRAYMEKTPAILPFGRRR